MKKQFSYGTSVGWGNAGAGPPCSPRKSGQAKMSRQGSGATRRQDVQRGWSSQVARKLAASLAQKAGAGLLHGCSWVTDSRHNYKVCVLRKTRVRSGDNLILKLSRERSSSVESKMAKEGMEMPRDPVT